MKLYTNFHFIFTVYNINHFISEGGGGLSGGEVAGIVIGVLIAVALIVLLGAFIWKQKGGKLPSIPTPGFGFNRFGNENETSNRGLPSQEA